MADTQATPPAADAQEHAESTTAASPPPEDLLCTICGLRACWQPARAAQAD